VIWQTGSGTQSNMNVNEVIANRAVLKGFNMVKANNLLKPMMMSINHNLQMTPSTGMHIAAYKAVVEVTIPGVEKLRDTLHAKAIEFNTVVKIGRTHLMDATTYTLGQEISGYVAQLNYGLKAVKNTLAHLSGCSRRYCGRNRIKYSEGYDVKVAEYIAEFTGHPFVTAENKFEALAAHDAIVETQALKQLAVSLNKIANDVRMLASGPRSGMEK
jgi:fumarate hydratase class II